MECGECGAEDCEERYHTLLAAEWSHPEAARMHSLFILVYHAQHPSRVEPWMRDAQREWLRGIFVENKDWRRVLAWPSDRRERQRAVNRMKERFANAPDAPEFGHPVEGEMTVADVCAPGSSEYPDEYPENIEAWAESVAKRRLS